MEILNTTHYDKKRLLKFNSFTVSRNIGIWIIISIATALVSACYVLQFLFLERSTAISFSFFFIIFFDVLYVLMAFVFPAISIKKSKSNNITIHYVFKDNTFFMSAETPIGTEKAELPYGNIIKASEAEDDIYLYIAKNQAYIVDKSGFPDNNLTAFKNLICEKVKITRLR